MAPFGMFMKKLKERIAYDQDKGTDISSLIGNFGMQMVHSVPCEERAGLRSEQRRDHGIMLCCSSHGRRPCHDADKTGDESAGRP